MVRTTFLVSSKLRLTVIQMPIASSAFQFFSFDKADNTLTSFTLEMIVIIFVLKISHFNSVYKIRINFLNMRIEKFNIRLAAVLENFRYQTSQGHTGTHNGGPLIIVYLNGPWSPDKTRKHGHLEKSGEHIHLCNFDYHYFMHHESHFRSKRLYANDSFIRS